MYYLILTLFIVRGGGNASSTSVTQVGSFSTQQSCLVAGNAWLSKVQGSTGIQHISAICVKDR